eukprot:7113906-Prymnesium_polylepis.1
MVEASCGHWPSGWQSAVQWPGLDYTGVDLLREQTDANAALVGERGKASFGLRSATFMPMDMTRETLPAADLLLTTDTLIHLPNSVITRFLNLSVLQCPARYKYVLFVHDQLAPMVNQTVNPDISRSGAHHLDMSTAPFGLNVTTLGTCAWMRPSNTPHTRLVWPAPGSTDYLLH